MTNVLEQWVLTVLIFLPIFGALTLYVLPSNKVTLQRHFALAISILEFLISVYLVVYFVPDVADIQFSQIFQWLPKSVGVQYIVGVDGISLMLVMLTTILCPVVLMSTYSSIQNHVREFVALFLLLEAFMIGALVSLDLVLFYVFWEAMLIPMYFMIGIWGGKDRIYATTKFFIYTVIGSLLMLVAFIYLYYAHAQIPGNVYTTNILELYKTAAHLPFSTQLLLFMAATFAFAIKVPLFPFHTWLPDAHVQAPTPGSVILAGVLLKMGTYGLLRFSIPLFPHAAQFAAPVMIILAIVGVVYGALIAWRQTDIKKLIAYSSVSHLGFVVAGLFVFNEFGSTGALYQMINHGLSTGALFLLIGALYERRHTREMSDFGGLAKVMPWFATFLVIATLGAVALPGTGGFIGEFLILNGLYQAYPIFAVIAGSGVVFGAVYMLWFVLKIIWGPLKHEANQHLKDCSLREKAILGFLSIAIFMSGFISSALLEHTQVTLNHLNSSVLRLVPYETKFFDSAASHRNAASSVRGVK